MQLYLRLFFFSSRRRHTRFDCDWSSDVCSSDLGETAKRSSSSSNARARVAVNIVARSFARDSFARALSAEAFVRAMLDFERALAEAEADAGVIPAEAARRSEEHTSELQSQSNLVCRL